jgi:hypothetical protein
MLSDISGQQRTGDSSRLIFEGRDDRLRLSGAEPDQGRGFQWKPGPGERTRYPSLKNTPAFDFKARGEAGRFRGIFPPALWPLIVQALPFLF